MVGEAKDRAAASCALVGVSGVVRVQILRITN